MTESPSESADRSEAVMPDIDTSVAHHARIYDYLLGGTTNFEVDRQTAERAFAVYPGGIEGARFGARGNRAFLGRAVRWLAAEAGIRQFLDIGSGIPTEQNTHQVAQQTAPDARITYVDHDPIVLAHSHQLLGSTPQGATAYVQADLLDPEAILRNAAASLDLTQPVAVMLVAILHLVHDEDDPYGVVARLVEAVPSGSYVVISHLTNEVGAMAETAKRLNESARGSMVLRTRAQISRFFDGLELIDPGVVPVDDWHPDPRPSTAPQAPDTPVYAGVARKT